MTKRIIRVFPSQTKATPEDKLVRFGGPGLFDEADEIHVSVTFTWDQHRAEQLAYQWQSVAPVKIGGVGWRSEQFPFGDPGAEFVPGRYIRLGYVFTSRGCPRKCEFCSVPLRDPLPRLLPIQDGWNILDDNLLACPRRHVEAVFTMLRHQGRRIEFTGGLEARSLKDYQVGLLADLRPRPNCFWAYDPEDSYETLQSAARRLIAAGFTARSHRLRCYVLIGYRGLGRTPDDSLDAAEKRLQSMLALGFTPFAMLYRSETADKWRPDHEWKRLQRRWTRPALIHAARSELSE